MSRYKFDFRLFTFTLALTLTLTLNQSFLSQAIDPPSLSAMDTAWTTLQEIGAVDSDNKLTALGKHIVSSFQPRLLSS